MYVYHSITGVVWRECGGPAFTNHVTVSFPYDTVTESLLLMLLLGTEPFTCRLSLLSFSATDDGQRGRHRELQRTVRANRKEEGEFI